MPSGEAIGVSRDPGRGYTECAKFSAFIREAIMSSNGKYPPRRPVPGPNDPLEIHWREEAAYQRERERLVRDHLGKVALICGDDVIGVFDNCDDGLLEGYRRFGDVEMVLRMIEEDDGPFFSSLVDINHPSLRKTN
jgi:hypothetical protein